MMSEINYFKQVKALISESDWYGFRFSEGFLTRLTQEEQLKLIELLSKALNREIDEED